MKNMLLIMSVVITLTAGNLHASEASGDHSSKNVLTDSHIQDMKRQHRIMTRAALSEPGMEARRKLMLSDKDDKYHKMIKSGDINLSESERLEKDQFIH